VIDDKIYDDDRILSRPVPEPSAVDRLAALEDSCGAAAKKVARWEEYQAAEASDRARWFDGWLS